MKEEKIDVEDVKSAIRNTCFDIIDNCSLPDNLDSEQSIRCVVKRFSKDLFDRLGIEDS